MSSTVEDKPQLRLQILIKF